MSGYLSYPSEDSYCLWESGEDGGMNIWYTGTSYYCSVHLGILRKGYSEGARGPVDHFKITREIYLEDDVFGLGIYA